MIRKNAKDIEKTIEKLYKDDTVNLREYLNSDIEEQEEIKEEKDLNKETVEKNLELETKDDIDKEENK